MRHKIFVTSALFTLFLNLTLLPSTRAAAGPSFRVEGAGLSADPVSYIGPCPGLIKFKGKIQASAAGRVKYTYSYSDRGSGPEGFVDFEGPGIKYVETTWRVGDARVLPQFEGWAKLMITSPNAYESNLAKFAVVCSQGSGQQPPSAPRQVPPPPSGGPQDDFAQIYLTEVPRLSAPQQQEFNAELNRLKTFAEAFQPKLAAAQKQLGFDAEAMREEFRAVADDKDEAKRSERTKAFDTKYEPRVLELYRTAGIDLNSEKQRMSAALPAPGNVPPRPIRLLSFLIFPGPPPNPQPPNVPPEPDVNEQVFRAPFTSRGARGDNSDAFRNNGFMFLFATVGFAASEQRLAFITQDVSVERGVRNIRVSANLDPVSHRLTGLSVLAGYSSAEAIVNLRVMEGSRQVCGDRVSLGRMVTAVTSWGFPSGTRPVTLQCHFTRSAADSPANYTLVAEFEGWAGAGGIAAASVDVHGTLQQFQVFLDRR